jgi:hypothetical protein
MNMLVQQSELKAASAHDVATIRAFVTSDKTKDRALSGAISTYKSGVFSGIYLQGRAAQDILNAVGFVNV